MMNRSTLTIYEEGTVFQRFPSTAAGIAASPPPIVRANNNRSFLSLAHAHFTDALHVHRQQTVFGGLAREGLDLFVDAEI